MGQGDPRGEHQGGVGRSARTPIFHKSRTANPTRQNKKGLRAPGEFLAMHQFAVWRVSNGSLNETALAVERCAQGGAVGLRYRSTAQSFC